MHTRSAALGVAIGLALAVTTTAIAEIRAEVNQNGRLVGYIVQKDGETVCKNPTVFVKFRGPNSYIVCD